MSAKKYETCQHKYLNITCAADFLRNTRMFRNIFFVVLLCLAHGKPVPSDPVLISLNIEHCREDPCLPGCEELFRQDALFDDPKHLIKVEGGDEYLVEMEATAVRKS